MVYRCKTILDVNGEKHTIELEPRTTLLEFLREQLDLTGAKRACDRGECGACTVLVDGEPMVACHLLAVQMNGRKIVTIEGLREREDFQPLLQAMVKHDAGQCGFCTPGIALAAYSLLKRYPKPDPWAIRWSLVGHICRCNAYEKIVFAIQQAGE